MKHDVISQVMQAHNLQEEGGERRAKEMRSLGSEADPGAAAEGVTKIISLTKKLLSNSFSTWPDFLTSMYLSALFNFSKNPYKSV